MTVLAWHFVGDTLRDDRPIPADGEWLEHEGPMILCESGLHASVDPFDALQFAPGGVLCRVECDGDMQHGSDKLIARRRRIVMRKDVTDLLRLFARRQALSVGHLWDMPAIVQQYLKTGAEELRSAAKDVASSAAWAAARAAARKMFTDMVHVEFGIARPIKE
jgi:hypothetical protein